MDIEQVREYALSLFGVTEDQPFGDDVVTFRVEGKYECGHNIHQGRDTHGKIGKNALRLTDFF